MFSQVLSSFAKFNLNNHVLPSLTKFNQVLPSLAKFNLNSHALPRFASIPYFSLIYLSFVKFCFNTLV
jgi:hypothetical protein